MRPAYRRARYHVHMYRVQPLIVSASVCESQLLHWRERVPPVQPDPCLLFLYFLKETTEYSKSKTLAVSIGDAFGRVMTRS